MTHRILSAAAVAAGLVLSGSAWGHALSVDKEAPAGGWHFVQIGIPHGCGGSPTTGVRINIPDDIFMVRPELKPGWEMSMKMRKMDPAHHVRRGDLYGVRRRNHLAGRRHW